MVKKQKKDNIVQVKNPQTKRFVKINKTKGTIMSYKQSPGPYKNIIIIKQ